MPNNSVISQIVLGSGASATTYDLKDAKARQDIAALEAYTDYLGVTTTALTDGATTNPITINGESVTAKKGNIVNYQAKEFIFNGTAWQEFGDLSGLGALAFVDEATGAYTPAGSVAAPTFTGSEMTSTGSFTPAGSVAAPTFTGSEMTSTGSFTPAGSVAAPTFTGSEMTSTGSFTPAGTIDTPTITVTPVTDTVYSITDVGTLPEMTVSGEVLTFTAGTLPTKGSAQTVVASATAALDAAPTFTGTAGSVSVTGTPEGTNSAPAFTGTAGSISVTGTPEGTNSAPAFTGTAGSVSVTGTPEGTNSAPTFTGTAATITVGVPTP